ncbi:MAG: hypothetical protein K6U12_00670 [Armatimonadetes bacterium]|jgi:hypothetical protein|nr:hypothetical protein [Armatimonadota bacterium]
MQELERALRMRLSPELHTALEREGLIGAYLAAVTPEEQQEAIDAIRAYIRRSREREPKQQSGAVYTTTALEQAYVALQAREVSKLAAVAQQGDTLYPLRVLREQYLRGEFLPVEGVQDWLQHHLTDGQPLPSTRLTLTPEAETRVLQARQQGQPVEIQPSEFVRVEQYYETLHYGGRVYPVRFDGALRWLWQASRALMRLCGWAESDAIEFALCNRVPDGLAIEYRAEWSLSAGLAFLGEQVPLYTSPEKVAQLYALYTQVWHFYSHAEWSLLAGLAFLSVRAPFYTPPEKVAQLYARVQRFCKRKARYKGVSDFTARFVRFVECYRLQHPRASWKEIITEWNRQNPSELIDERRARSLSANYNAHLRAIHEQVASLYVLAGMPTASEDSATDCVAGEPA